VGEPGFFETATSEEDILAAYRWILGRDPRSAAESERLLADHPTRGALRRFLLATKGSLHEHLKSRFGAEKWVLAEVFDGLRLWLNLCDRHVSMGGLVGTWEEGETRFMRSALKPGQTVVDIGANIGWFTLTAAQCVGPGGRVHAFEPQARIFHYLARTIAENDLLGRVLPYEMALSDRWGSVDMAWNPNSANMGHAWLAVEAPAQGSLGQVRTGVLDDILGSTKVDFIKLDTEGAEALVLAGAAKILQASRPIVMLEILPAYLQRVSGAAPEAVFARFHELDYGAFEILADGLGGPVTTWPAEAKEMNLAFLPH
jgi:FkbM family methyltransferase